LGLGGCATRPRVVADGARGGQAPVAAPGTTATRDLADHAVIRRDGYGVPHILGETEEAAAFAHGYATAEDHGALLARGFLRARGALASVFGADFVDEDVRTRTLRIHDTAAERFHELPPYMQAILNAYAAGYNRYLAQRRGDLPAWASPVTGVDVLAHCRALLLLDFALDPTPWRKPPHQGASSMWAIAPSRSQSGHTLLLANPHLAWEPPDLFHEVHITVPGVVNVSGAAFVGSPVVAIGFNEYLGWAHTVNLFDAEDTYALSLDATRTHYAYEGHWLPLRRRPFDVEVRTGKRLDVQRHVALWSHYGPVARVEGDKAYAVKSPSLDLVQFLTEYNSMAKATSLESFKAAVNMQQLPVFNLGYADRAGNIWYLFNGRLPIRPPGYDFTRVVPGDTSRTEWFAVRPVSEMPQLLNPPSGYVQNTNAAPWYTTLEEGIDRAPFVSYLRSEGINWRAQFSLELLSSTPRLTLAQAMEQKFNSTLVYAQRVKGDLVAALRGRGERWRRVADLLEAWDDTTDADTRGAVLFEAWWAEYGKAVAAPFRVPWNRAQPASTPTGLADPDRAVEALERAVAKVEQAHGAIDVRWGDVHRARRGDLDLPVGGNTLAFQNLAYRVADDGRAVAVAGDTYVLAVEFSDPPLAYSLLPYSQSSNPRSPHFNDQLQLYVSEQFKRAWFTERDIAANLQREYRPGR
jgi:acyl-homoserine-lactone acylase